MDRTGRAAPLTLRVPIHHSFPQRKTAVHPYALRFCIGENKRPSIWERRVLSCIPLGTCACGAEGRPRLTHGPRAASPQGKRLTMICASLALLHPLLSLTHWIFRSLMLPYKSSSHSANHVRCASLRSRGSGRGGHLSFIDGAGMIKTSQSSGPKTVKLTNPTAEGRSILRTFPYEPSRGALHLISNPVFRCIQGTSIL